MAAAAVAMVIAASSLPFLFNERFGVLGEGVYTNDHAAQLYWADWLQHGFGEEPDAVRFGYPVGPQAVAAIAATATGADLVESFNGLLLAIPALTALTALALLGGLPPGRRVAAASLTALPYLGASFLAQSAFKETAMALLLLGFVVTLRGLARAELPRRAALAVFALLALAAVLTYSIPGIAWFVLALAIWLAIELAAGRRPLGIRSVRDAVARHRRLAVVAGVLAVAALAVAIGPATAFFERITAVQESVGRLGSPVFAGEVFGVWPEGDYRIVRGDVPGAVPATLVGFAALCIGVWALARRGEVALVAALAAAAAVYAATRLEAQIHVQAKALAVMAPLVMLVSLRALLAPVEGAGGERRLATGRLAFGIVFALAAAASTLIALRAAPVGFDDRARGLERLGERIEGSSVAFLGVDRFGAYRLRGTEVRSPGGYVPPKVRARERKRWRQGIAIDFDTLSPGVLDRFDYAVTTTAAFASSPPPNMRLVATDGDYALWERNGQTPPGNVLPEEDADPGAVLDCELRPPRRFRSSDAVVIGRPVTRPADRWSGTEPIDPKDAAAGQENAFRAPGTGGQVLELGEGRWQLSLQYHSQVPLTIEVDGEGVAELPASLDGMYLVGAGRGAFWPAGEVDVAAGAGRESVTVTVAAAEPTWLQRTLGVERRVWLGRLAASPASEPETVPVADACDRYVDRIVRAR
ncbi:MAG TPA: hypothetical protein VK919_08355 [Solirubrobacterales bacterium]|nr:hypothetical protein [Solirubrobacterales bacterium]